VHVFRDYNLAFILISWHLVMEQQKLLNCDKMAALFVSGQWKSVLTNIKKRQNAFLKLL